MSEVTEILEELDKWGDAFEEKFLSDDGTTAIERKTDKMLIRIIALLQSHAVIDRETAQHLSLMAVANESSCAAQNLASEATINKCRTGRVGQTVDILKAELSRLTEDKE